MSITPQEPETPCPRCAARTGNPHVGRSNQHPLAHVHVVDPAGSTTLDTCMDVRVAPVVAELARLGIATIDSCQDAGDGLRDFVADGRPHLEPYRAAHVGWAYVGLRTAEGLGRLVDLVKASPACSEELRERTWRWYRPGAWRFTVVMLPTDDGTRPRGFRVDLPTSDLELVAAALAAIPA